MYSRLDPFYMLFHRKVSRPLDSWFGPDIAELVESIYSALEGHALSNGRAGEIFEIDEVGITDIAHSEAVGNGPSYPIKAIGRFEEETRHYFVYFESSLTHRELKVHECT